MSSETPGRGQHPLAPLLLNVIPCRSARILNPFQQITDARVIATASRLPTVAAEKQGTALDEIERDGDFLDRMIGIADDRIHVIGRRIARTVCPGMAGRRHVPAARYTLPARRLSSGADDCIADLFERGILQRQTDQSDRAVAILLIEAVRREPAVASRQQQARDTTGIDAIDPVAAMAAIGRE